VDSIENKDIEIARFEPEDEQGVMDLILPIQRDEFGFSITAQDQPDLGTIPEFYQSGKGDFWVARCGGKLVGSIGLKDIGRGQAALRKMFVDSAFRGRELGVGAKLLAHLLEEAQTRGLHEVLLGTTDRFLAAHRFYEKHGFVSISQAELPESFPRMALDTRFYRFRKAG
jgi:N-acetylglutamate synthase-like GNAT family acetyltransferase